MIAVNDIIYVINDGKFHVCDITNTVNCLNTDNYAVWIKTRPWLQPPGSHNIPIRTGRVQNAAFSLADHCL